MDRRTVLAFVLIGILTVAYFWIILPARPSRVEPSAVAPSTVPPSPKTAQPSPEVSATNPATLHPAAPPVVEPISQEPIHDDIALKGTGLKYDMRWSNQGACLRTARLNDYPQKRGLPQGVLLLDAPTALPMDIRDVTDIARETGFKDFRSAAESGGVVRGFCVPGGGWLSKGRLDRLAEYAGGFGAKGLAWFRVKEQSLDSPIASQVTGQQAAIRERMGAQPGDLLLFVADNSPVVSSTLEALRQEVARTPGMIPPATFALIDANCELPLDGQVYKVVEDSDKRLAFAATFGNGLRVTKEFHADPDKKYDLLAKVTLENTGAQPLPAQYQIVAASRLVPESESSTEVQAALGSRYETGRINIDRLAPSRVSKGPKETVNNTRQPLVWAGAGNRYFAAILTPAPKEGGSTFGFILSASVSSLPRCDELPSTSGSVSSVDNAAVKLLTVPRTLKPGETVSDDYAYFLGPKKQDVLEQYPDLSDLLNYGFFGFVSKALLLILRGLHHVIHNYGVGIVLLTIVIKVCLHPMTRKGQIAMARMQKLQPLIKELQAKYKDDRQRQGREMMELYRKHNANPMSGCWPMLFQLPILWGLYQMLLNSIDLRQQPFFLWVSDLSRPDTIAHWGGFPIHVLPVLMTICSLVQQMMMPKPADPQQAQTQKMMMFMPLLFLFMFYPMASGLVLYWLMFALLGIVEQRLIKLEIQRMEAQGAFAAETVAAESEPVKRKPKRQ